MQLGVYVSVYAALYTTGLTPNLRLTNCGPKIEKKIFFLVAGNESMGAISKAMLLFFINKRGIRILRRESGYVHNQAHLLLRILS